MRTSDISRTAGVLLAMWLTLTVAAEAWANPGQGQLFRAGINLGWAQARISLFNEGDVVQAPEITAALARAAFHLGEAEALFFAPFAGARGRMENARQTLAAIAEYESRNAGRSKIARAAYVHQIYFGYAQSLLSDFDSRRLDGMAYHYTCDYAIFTIGYYLGRAEIAAAIGPLGFNDESVSLQSVKDAIINGGKVVWDTCCGFYPRDEPSVWDPFLAFEPRFGPSKYESTRARVLDIVDRAVPPILFPCKNEEPFGRHPCASLAGKWNWFANGPVVISLDGTLTQQNLTGRLSCEGRNIVIVWSHGFTDHLQLADDGQRLEGYGSRDPNARTGHRVWGSRSAEVGVDRSPWVGTWAFTSTCHAGRMRGTVKNDVVTISVVGGETIATSGIYSHRGIVNGNVFPFKLYESGKEIGAGQWQLNNGVITGAWHDIFGTQGTHRATRR